MEDHTRPDNQFAQCEPVQLLFALSGRKRKVIICEDDDQADFADSITALSRLLIFENNNRIDFRSPERGNGTGCKSHRAQQ
jgi:hypothetical protein